MASHTESSARHGVITAVVCLALAAVVAAMSSLNVALPDIARDTHASQTQLVWVIDAYSLAFAALLLPGGALGDRYGRRVSLLIGLLIFGGGSAVAMSADSATELIALRAVLGVGAALVMPATLSTITSTFPPAQRTRAVSIWAAVAGGAAILGLLCSGLLLTVFSWRSIFGLNVLLSAFALAGTVRFVPESANQDAPRLDVGGALLAVAALSVLVFSVIEAGWPGGRSSGSRSRWCCWLGSCAGSCLRSRRCLTRACFGTGRWHRARRRSSFSSLPSMDSRSSSCSTYRSSAVPRRCSLPSKCYRWPRR
jgi:MFS family permease